MLEVDIWQIPGGRRTERFDKATLVVGRSAKCDIVVRDPDVSRRHLTIDLVHGELWAEDMGSSNGSTLDGEPLAERSRVAQGQVLRVCDHEFRIRIMDDHAAEPVRASQNPPLAQSGGYPQNPAHSGRTAATYVATHVPGHANAEPPDGLGGALHGTEPMYGSGAHPQAQPGQPTPYGQTPPGPAPAYAQPQHYPPQEARGQGPQYPPVGAQPPPNGGHESARPDARRQQATPQVAPRVSVAAPSPGRIELPTEGSSTSRAFECRENLWQSYEQLAHESGVSVDELLNEALAFYGRRRVQANAGSAAQPETSLRFVPSPANIFERFSLPKR